VAGEKADLSFRHKGAAREKGIAGRYN